MLFRVILFTRHLLQTINFILILHLTNFLQVFISVDKNTIYIMFHRQILKYFIKKSFNIYL